MTGIYNRTEFNRRLSLEFERSLSKNNPFALLMMDIDYLKRINDTYGHPVGDNVIIETAKRIQGCIRNFDSLARCGGEEFAVILPETDGNIGFLAGERIPKTIYERSYELSKGHFALIFISIGIASFPLDSRDLEGLVIAAHEALYYSKKNGRNRIFGFREINKAV